MQKYNYSHVCCECGVSYVPFTDHFTECRKREERSVAVCRDARRRGDKDFLPKPYIEIEAIEASKRGIKRLSRIHCP